MSPSFEELTFTDSPPSIEDISDHLYQRTGLQVLCQQDASVNGPDSFTAVYVLTNPEDQEDSLELLYDQDGQLYLSWGAPTTYLVGATLHTLVAMGGNYNSKIPAWTSKNWLDIAEKAKSLPRYEHPDWIFD